MVRKSFSRKRSESSAGLNAAAGAGVDAAHRRLAELEVGFAIEMAKVKAMKARLFAGVREHFQRGDGRQLLIGYRRKYLESLARQGEEEAGKTAQEYRQASVQTEREYAETAAALAGEQEADHRLTTRTSAFFDETVGRHVEALEKERRLLENEAEELAREIEELTGAGALGCETNEP